MPSYEKTALNAIKILAGFVFLIPLFFSDTFFFPFTFPKTILFRTAVEILFIFWLPLVIFYPKYRPRFSWPLLAITALLALGYLSAAFNEGFQRSFWSDFERMMGLITYTHFWVFFLILISVIREEAAWKNFMFISLVVSTLVSLYGIYQKLFLPELFGRAESTVGNAGFLASYLLIHIFIALFLLSREDKVWWRGTFFAISAFVSALGLFFTGTRGALLGLVVGALILLIIYVFFGVKRFWIFKGRNFRYVSLILLSSFLVLGALFFFFRAEFSGSSFEPLRRAASVSLSERTIQGRLLSWRVAIDGIKEKPILGWGPENFIILFNRHYDSRLFNQEAWFDRSHNIILDVFSNLGILGLGAFLFLIGAVFRIVFSDKIRWTEAEKGIMISFGAAYLVNALFIFDNALTLIPLSFLFAYLASDGGPRVSSPGVSWASVSAVAVPAFVLASVAFYFSAALPYFGNKNAKSALGVAFSRVGDVGAVNEYERTLLESGYGDVEPRRLFADFVFDVERSGLPVPPKYKREALNTALSLIELNREYEPDNARWVVYEANILNLLRPFGDEFASRAEKLVKENLKLSPARQQMYFDLAQAQFDQNKTSEMFATLDRAIELEPRYPVAHRHKASFAILSGRENIAEDEIGWLRENSWGRTDNPAEVGWHTPDFDMEIFSENYVAVGEYDKAAGFYEMRIKIFESSADKNDASFQEELADLYARLAALFALSGDLDSAYDTALKVIEIDSSPKRLEEAENFLRTIGRSLP